MVFFKKVIDLFALVAFGLLEKKAIARLFHSLPSVETLRQINFKKGLTDKKVHYIIVNAF